MLITSNLGFSHFEQEVADKGLYHQKGFSGLILDDPVNEETAMMIMMEGLVVVSLRGF
jgi:hypothetical protein